MKSSTQTQAHMDLRGHGLKATPPRVQLLKYLEKVTKPLSAPAIAKYLKKEADQATVYRNLNSLLESGMVRRIDLHHGHAHYELANRKDHHHLVCTKCGQIEDFTGCDFEEITRTALKQSKNFSRVTQHSLELFGLCKSCAKK